MRNILSAQQLVWAVLWCCVASSCAKTFQMNETVLGPGQVHAEIHPIKGGGGEIEVDNLRFRLVSSPPQAPGSSDSYYYTDVAVVRVNPGCQNVDDDVCQWAKQGLGDITDAGDFEFCCTQELLSEGKCASPDRLITDNYSFFGLSRYVTLSPGNNIPQTISYSYMDENQAGMYALLLVNCNTDASVQVTGNVRWTSYPKDSPFGETSGLTLASDLERMARHCDIDVDFFTPQDEFDGVGPPNDDAIYFVKTVTSHFEEVADTCTADQVAQLNQAFDDFETCADGWDLQAFIEDLPSGLLGTLIECAVTTDWEQISDWTDIDELMSVELSDKCLDFEFGDNALGHGLRQMALNPDKLLPCFKALAPKVPSCTLETWPVPIVGSWLKTGACMAGEATGLKDDLLEIEMDLWNKCLPDDSTSTGTYSCDTEDCLYEGSLLVRSGSFALPVSDAMERLATGKPNLQTALNRYKRFLEECTDIWDGWSSYTDNVAPGPSPRHSPDDATNADGGSSNNSSGISKGGLAVLMLLAGLFLGAFTVMVLQKYVQMLQPRTTTAVETTKSFDTSYTDSHSDEGTGIASEEQPEVV